MPHTLFPPAIGGNELGYKAMYMQEFITILFKVVPHCPGQVHIFRARSPLYLTIMQNTIAWRMDVLMCLMCWCASGTTTSSSYTPCRVLHLHHKIYILQARNTVEAWQQGYGSSTIQLSTLSGMPCLFIKQNMGKAWDNTVELWALGHLLETIWYMYISITEATVRTINTSCD